MDQPEESSRSPAAHTVLLVDDNSLERSKLKGLLEDRGHLVREAKDAKHALAMLKRTVVHLAIVDLDIKGVGGKDLMFEMAKEGHAVPIIVIARQTSLEQAVECMRHGAVNILSRPFENDAFIGAVQGALLRRDAIVARGGPPTPATGADGPAPTAEGGRSETRQPTGSTPAPTPASTHADQPAIRLVKAQLDQGNLNLPSIPVVLRELRRLMDDPKYNTSQLVQLVEGDQELAVKVLRRANSAAYRGSSPVSSIANALVRLGGRSVLSIALRTMTDRMCRTVRSPILADLSIELWKRSVETAVATRLVARHLQGSDPDGLYLLALLAEVGEPFLVRFADDILRSRAEEVSLDAARHEIGRYHAEVGCALLKRWEMRAEAVEVAKLHHDLNAMRQLVAKSRPLGKVLFAIALGRHVCREVERARMHDRHLREHGGGTDPPPPDPPPLHPGDPTLAECESVLMVRHDVFDRLCQALRHDVDDEDRRRTSNPERPAGEG